MALLLSGCVEDFDPATLEAARPLEPPWPIAAFELDDQHGTRFGRDDLEGRWTLLFSGFTHCPDICPATLGVLRAARQASGNDAVRTVFVTVDPDRDTPEVLAGYLAWFDEDWIGLSGSPEELERLLDSLQMASVRVPLGRGEYTMDHATAIALIGPDATVVAYWPAPHDPAALARDLARLPRR